MKNDYVKIISTLLGCGHSVFGIEMLLAAISIPEKRSMLLYASLSLIVGIILLVISKFIKYEHSK